MVDETLGNSGSLRIGCAGWSLPKEYVARFPAEGTHLTRFAARFPAVEINSSFYRPHRPATYERWAASVPEGFRFAVKVPRGVTHERRLVGATDLLATFLDEASHLGDKLGPLLVQMPPSLRFSSEVAEAFFQDLRSRFDGEVAVEPRHATWFEPDADRLMTRHRLARVAADPAVVPEAAQPGGWPGLAYYRLHGSPKVYYSSYPHEYLSRLADTLATATEKANVWCIFDNTAEGAAIENGLELLERIGRR